MSGRALSQVWSPFSVRKSVLPDGLHVHVADGAHRFIFSYHSPLTVHALYSCFWKRVLSSAELPNRSCFAYWVSLISFRYFSQCTRTKYTFLLTLKKHSHSEYLNSGTGQSEEPVVSVLHLGVTALSEPWRKGCRYSLDQSFTGEILENKVHAISVWITVTKQDSLGPSWDGRLPLCPLPVSSLQKRYCFPSISRVTKAWFKNLGERW